MNFWNRFKYALSDHPPDGIIEEEWEQIKADRRAEEQRRDEIDKQAIANFKNTQEYKSAGFFKRLRMVFYYRVFLDKSGEMQIGEDDSDNTTEEIIAILNEETEALAKMPREERLAYFKRMDKFNNMNFTMDFGTTILHVNTHFAGKTDETVADTVKRVSEHSPSN